MSFQNDFKWCLRHFIHIFYWVRRDVMYTPQTTLFLQPTSGDKANRPLVQNFLLARFSSGTVTWIREDILWSCWQSVIICLDNGLTPCRCQANIQTNDDWRMLIQHSACKTQYVKSLNSLFSSDINLSIVYVISGFSYVFSPRWHQAIT